MPTNLDRITANGFVVIAGAEFKLARLILNWLQTAPQQRRLGEICCK